MPESPVVFAVAAAASVHADGIRIADAEVLRAQSGVGVAYGFGETLYFTVKPVKGFTGFYGVESFFL